MGLFASQRPQPRPSCLIWSYRRILPGQALKGWVAGDLVGVTVHWSGSSKPCRKRLTEGLLPCAMCDAQMRGRWLGYLPLYDHHGKKCVVCVSETVGPVAGNIAFGTPIEITRSNGQRDPVRITCSPIGQAGLPVAIARNGPQDITPWLIHLWQDKELASYFASQAHAQVTGSSEHSANSQTAEGQVDSTAAPKPSTNGTHHGERSPTTEPGGSQATAGALTPAGGGGLDPVTRAKLRAHIDSFAGDEQPKPAKRGRPRK